nr:hypothetical protein [Tanacetum cinerariifolium]
MGQGLGLAFGHGNQDDGLSKYYSMAYSEGRDSAYSSAPVKDESPVEEVAPEKPKKVSKCASKAKKNDSMEMSKPWTTPKETVLYKAWCDVLENSVRGNAMNNRAFFKVGEGEIILYFEKETGETRGYNAITGKWKDRVRPRTSAFCAIIDNVKRRNESGLSDLILYHKALAKYEGQYE